MRRSNTSIAVQKLALFLALFLALNAARVAAQSDETGEIVLTAKAGFDGFYKPDYGVPVQVTVANNGPALEGELQIVFEGSSAGDRLIYRSPITLPTRSNKRVNLAVEISSFASRINVELVSDGGQTIAAVSSNRLTQVSAEDLLYGVLSSAPGELSFLENVRGGRAKASVAFLTPDLLPEVSSVWNALDVLILNDVDSGELSTEQLNAAQGWTSTGGLLVITGGPGWQKTTAAVADMLPVNISGIESVEDLPDLSESVKSPFRDPGPYLITASSLTNGEMIFHHEGLPLLARRPWGRGSVFYLALDPQLAPLLDWNGAESIWAAVVRRLPNMPTWGRGFQNGYAASTAVTSLPSLALPSVLQLILFLFVYVIVVGPINYLWLKRRGRLELTWVTVPVLVLLFSGLAYLAGFQLKGNEVILNQMSVATGQLDGDKMRVQSLLGLYSPRRSRYEMIFPADTIARPFESNFGRPGGGGNIDGITRGSELIISGIRVDVSGTETFVANNYRDTLPVSGNATLRLENNLIHLDFELLNASPFDLENSALLLGSDIISLGTLKAGERIAQSQIVAAGTGNQSSPTSPPPRSFVPSPGSGSPLTFHADKILGTSDYYNDREAFPRWQLLQSLEGEYYRGPGGIDPSRNIRQNVLTFVAWSEDPQLEVTLDGAEHRQMATTLYLLELPMAQNIISGNNVSLPVSLLNWRVLAESNTYQASIHNLYLQGGWVEFEYEPWPEFQTMRVTQLAVAMDEQDPTQSAPVPEIRLWNWNEEVWEEIRDAKWGVTQIGEPQPYIGSGNKVRVRIQDRASFGTGLSALYPVLVGDLQ